MLDTLATLITKSLIQYIQKIIIIYKRDGDGSAGPRHASQKRRIPEGKKSTPNILSVIMETAELLKT